MTDAPLVKIVAGKPTDALQRQRINSYSFGNLVPRHNYVDYRARQGKTNLETLRLIRDRDPDASQAVMNFLLLIGQGYETQAQSGETVDEKATAYIRDLDSRVGMEYGGGMDALVDVLTLTLVTQGAMAGEIEVSDDLAEVIDLHPIDPARVSAKREKDTQRLMWGMQVQRGTAGADRDGFLEFSPRQFRYIPLHPDVDDPYGRSPLLAALTAIFFKVQVLADLQAVVHNQGYPRLKVAILEETITNSLAPGTSILERTRLVQELQLELSAAFASLHPDDAIIQPSSVEVGYLGLPGNTLVDVKALADVLDKQIVSGLKQLPSLLGRNEGNTSTHATVQWKIFVRLVESLRRKLKRLLEWYQTTALQVAGFQATAHVSFEELQTNDRLVDAQAFETEVRTWSALADRGWASDVEASQALLHHDPAGTPAPVPEPLRRPRASRRRVLPRTRAVAPHDAERRDLETQLRDAVGAQFTRLAGDFPVVDVVEQVSGLTEIDPAEVERIVAAWFDDNPGQRWSQELTDILAEHYMATFQVIGQLALDDLGITASFDLTNPRQIELLQELAGNRVTGIDDETRRTIVNQLVEGTTAGEGVEQLGRRLRAHIDDMSVRRSQLIATTEVATATGMASLEAYTRNGVEQKGWLTAGDDKVTEGCQENEDASPVAIDASFPSGHDAPPRFPGCRCAVTPVLDGYIAPETAWTGA